MLWHPALAELLVVVASGIPCYGSAIFLGLGRLILFRGRILVYYSLFFQTPILSFSAVSSCDFLKGWCSPSLSILVLREDVERKCCSQGSHSCISVFHFSPLSLWYLIAHKFLINSVALHERLTSGATKSGKPFGLNPACIFPLRTQLCSWALHQPWHCSMRMPRDGATQS